MSIPVIAGFFGVQRAVLIMVVPGLVTNAWLLWRYREHFRATRDLPVLLEVFALMQAVSLTAVALFTPSRVAEGLLPWSRAARASAGHAAGKARRPGDLRPAGPDPARPDRVKLVYDALA